MKTKINDLLLKMQTGENCIGETANALLNLYSVSNSVCKAEELLRKHLEKKNLTNEHIHVAAYMSCLDAINEALNISIVNNVR